jgi:hypothetical protein
MVWNIFLLHQIYYVAVGTTLMGNLRFLPRIIDGGVLLLQRSEIVMCNIQSGTAITAP